MHDPKGWDLIGELLKNPELIENFTGAGAEGLQQMLGGASKSTKTGASSKRGKDGGSKSGEDIGVGFNLNYI